MNEWERFVNDYRNLSPADQAVSWTGLKPEQQEWLRNEYGLEPPAAPKRVFHYKVVELRQRTMVKGAMTAMGLQNLINQHAENGWILDRIVSGETARFLGMSDKDVLLVIFRQEPE